MFNIRQGVFRLLMRRFRYGMLSQLDLKEFVQDLLLRDPQVAQILIFLPERKEMLSFRRARGSVFQLHFPVSFEARRHFDRIGEILKTRNIESNLETRVYARKPRGFLLIDIHEDSDTAFEIIKAVLQGLFLLNDDDKVEVYYTIDSANLERFRTKTNSTTL